jgi:signal transduction histidine kinase
METLRAEFAATDLDRHLALFYDSPEEQLRTAAAFCADALRRDRRCLYLIDVRTRRDIERALSIAGVDVEARLNAGDLLIRDAETAYLEDGFDPERMLETLEEACEDSVTEGYAGLSVAGENSWCFHTGEHFEPILEFEAEFDARCPELPVTALCQYDLTTFSEPSIAKALWTHRQVIYRGQLCENPYYVPPEEYATTEDPQLNARLMLEQTHSLSTARRRIEAHEQRLSVINRVLRHNIRNELTVVLGNLDLLAERTPTTDDADELLADARDHASRVVDLAEKARYVETTLAEPTVVPTDVAAVVERVVERLIDVHPDVRFDVEGSAAANAMAVSDFDVAVTELATNAIEHATTEATDPWVTFSLSTTSDTVVLAVANPGEPIPGIDRRALLEGRETPLQHGRGLGLWIVKWLVESSHGTVRFDASEDDRSLVRIELPKTDRPVKGPEP